jgi:hypothetical protein
MPNFRPRISILTALLLMTIVGMAIPLIQLWREVGPLRADNNRLNEERGTLVIGDRSQLHAIQIPARFAGEGLTSFRIYVPPGQQYVAFVQVNGVPKTGVPKIRGKLSDYNSVLGGGSGLLYSRLEPGEQVLSIKTVRRGGKADIALVVGDPRASPIDASAQTPKDRWPTVVPETYSVYGGQEQRETLTTNGSEALAIKRYRTEGVSRDSLNDSWVTPEPDYPLDGYIRWVERTK